MEVDATCDRISIIKDGRLVSTLVANDLRHSESKEWMIEFSTTEDYNRFNERVGDTKLFFVTKALPKRNRVNVSIKDMFVNEFIAELSTYGINFFTEIKFTLEDYFMKFYDKNTQVQEGGIVNAVNSDVNHV